jgi:tRNA(fMet)-specific endonuclease VapC
VRILDTDHFSLLFRKDPKVSVKVALFKPEELAITIITAEEQLRGRLDWIRQAAQSSKPERLTQAYWLLK